MIKKQSSFLIESKPRRNNKSFLEFSVDDGTDNQSDMSGNLSKQGFLGNQNVRLKHQNSSSALLGKKGKIGLAGAFLGLNRQGSTDDHFKELNICTKKSQFVNTGPEIPDV